MRASRMITTLALMTMFGMSGFQSARADGPGNFGPPSRSSGFHPDSRPGFGGDFRHRGGHHDDFRRHRGPRFCWCGFDFERHRGHHHHHHDRFGRFPRFPRGGF